MAFSSWYVSNQALRALIALLALPLRSAPAFAVYFLEKPRDCLENPRWTVIPLCNITVRPRHKGHISLPSLPWLDVCSFH
jgi:hypothetical protein